MIGFAMFLMFAFLTTRRCLPHLLAPQSRWDDKDAIGLRPQITQRHIPDLALTEPAVPI